MSTNTMPENTLSEYTAYPFDTDEAYQVSAILNLDSQENIVHVQ
jgi:hypothetical protein